MAPTDTATTALPDRILTLAAEAIDAALSCASARTSWAFVEQMYDTAVTLCEAAARCPYETPNVMPYEDVSPFIEWYDGDETWRPIADVRTACRGDRDAMRRLTDLFAVAR